MAMSDYRLCDLCGNKAFYDANLSYEDGESSIAAAPFRIQGDEQFGDPDLNSRCGSRLGRLGDWVVLCNSCSVTHRCVIEPIATPEESPHGR